MRVRNFFGGWVLQSRGFLPGGDGAIFQPLSASLLQIPKGQSLVSVPPLGGWRSGGEGGGGLGREAVV